eukprot:1178744-Prorocentrum_minimum.AAC.4
MNAFTAAACARKAYSICEMPTNTPAPASPCGDDDDPKDAPAAPPSASTSQACARIRRCWGSTMAASAGSMAKHGASNCSIAGRKPPKRAAASTSGAAPRGSRAPPASAASASSTHQRAKGARRIESAAAVVGPEALTAVPVSSRTGRGVAKAAEARAWAVALVRGSVATTGAWLRRLFSGMLSSLGAGISWHKASTMLPSVGWLKTNVDGTSHSNA